MINIFSVLTFEEANGIRDIKNITKFKKMKFILSFIFQSKKKTISLAVLLETKKKMKMIK